MYTHSKQYLTAGTPVKEADKALILLHGRGGAARNMLGLAAEFTLPSFAVFAPQATQNSWYPYSFMAPEKENEPALSSAIKAIGEVVNDIKAAGISTENIFIGGFSQGACLTLEFVARNANPYGGVVAFTGGLIGEQLEASRYTGNFQDTPILITTGTPDPHVPLSRVEESVALLRSLNANVDLKVYPGRPHTITQQELVLANQLFAQQKVN